MRIPSPPLSYVPMIPSRLGQSKALAELPNAHPLPAQSRSKPQNPGKRPQTRSLSDAGASGLGLDGLC